MVLRMARSPGKGMLGPAVAPTCEPPVRGKENCGVMVASKEVK